MQAKLIKDIAATALGDRAWQRSLGASGLLHGAVLAAVLQTWHVEPISLPALHPIAVTLVHTDATAPERAAQPAQAIPEQPAPQQESTAATPPVATAAAAPPAPPEKPLHMAPATAKPAPPPASLATPKPNATITALLSESLDGRPRNGSVPPLDASSAIALRSSATLSDDYLLRLQAWIARRERYPAAARTQHQEGKGVVGFTIARDGKVTRVWIDQSTGSPLLDQASIATIRDSSPVLPLPHDIAGNSVDFYLPVNYALNTFERLFQ
jgi:periplasmic protein TonB